MRTSLCAAQILGGKRSFKFHGVGAALLLAFLTAFSFVAIGHQAVEAGCTDYGSILSSACDGCTSNCESLGAAAVGCGCDVGAVDVGGCGDVGMSDYVTGACGCGGSNGGCTGCGGSGLGCNFWNGLAGGGCGGGLGGGLLNCRVGGCGGGLLSGLLGCGRACGAADNCPGAGTQTDDGSAVYCGMPAPTYPVPYAVPTYVGHTQFAYPPFMPHHSLPHYRKIYSYRHAPGLSRTNVYWRNTTGRDILARLHNMIELPR